MNNIPVEIRSHLIPFFFQEMEGTPASYDGQKVKMIRLLPSSSLANYLYTLINYCRKANDGPNANFLLYLSVKTKNAFSLSGTIYIDKNGIKTELLLPLEKNRDINNLLEDIFRTALVFHIDGMRYARINTRAAIKIFMDKYNLHEYGFEVESIRAMYYAQKRKKVLNRFQKRASNQVIGFF